MVLNVIEFYNKNFFSQLGSEYICTGYMYNMTTTNISSMADQLSSWNLSSVQLGEGKKSSGGASIVGATSMGGQTGGTGGY